MSDDLIGKRLGGYEILDRIGQGGMATVYRARQISMNRIVALKILPKHLMRDDTYLQRFKREVDIVAQLEHRNIVPVHDYGDDDGQPYIAMRYMPAGSVDDLVKAGAMKLEDTLKIVKQIAPALDYAHSKNVLHRDLKPSNILMDDDGGAYITDFGIARIVGTESKGTTITTQGVVGTPSYMSPEQAQGHELDGRSDVYALGVMVFEMATGRRPFENDTPYGIAVMQVTTQPPNPRMLNASIPSSVEQVILKALKKKPENRYQTATELAEALEDAVYHPERKDDTQPSPKPPSAPMAFTQPSAALNPPFSPPAQPQNQPIPAQTPQPYYPQRSQTPPPITPRPNVPPQTGRNTGISQISRPVTPPKRRTRSNFWISVVIGGLIGCGLLIGLTVIAGMVARQLLIRDEEPTQPPAIGEAATSVLNQVEPEETLLFYDVTPIPTRTPLPIIEDGTSAAVALPSDLLAEYTQIVYFDDRSGEFHLYLYNLSTGADIPLTEGGYGNSYPAVSPDGQRIAFQSDRDGDWDIYIMDLASRETVKLVDTAVDERIPAWSSDGVYVVFSTDTRGDDTYDLVRVPADGGDPEFIYSNGKRNSHARYSPDGRYLVFTSGDARNANTWEILRFDFSDRDVVALTDNVFRDASPSFNPAGNRIIFNPTGEGSASIAMMNINGDGLAYLYDGEGYEWGMHYSPDGEYILFHEEIGGDSFIKVMRSDGSDVIDLNVMGFYPVWIP